MAEQSPSAVPQLPQDGPSTKKVLAVLTLLPVGGFCLFLSALILTGTVISVALAAPLFIIFSPILVPALLAVGLSVAGFLTSGAFGITALSSLTYIVNYFRKMRASGSGQVGTESQEPLKRKYRAQTGL